MFYPKQITLTDRLNKAHLGDFILRLKNTLRDFGRASAWHNFQQLFSIPYQDERCVLHWRDLQEKASRFISCSLISRTDIATVLC